MQQQPQTLVIERSSDRCSCSIGNTWIPSSSAVPVIALMIDVLRRSGWVHFRAVGSSMIPAIWPGDILVVHSRRIEKTTVGDVVLFTCYQGVVAHRVIEWHEAPCGSKPVLIAQGLTIPEPDPPVTEENLLGVVAYVIRSGKWFRPTKSPGLPSRVTSTIIRLSPFANRLLQRAHKIRHIIVARNTANTALPIRAQG